MKTIGQNKLGNKSWRGPTVGESITERCSVSRDIGETEARVGGTTTMYVCVYIYICARVCVCVYRACVEA